MSRPMPRRSLAIWRSIVSSSGRRGTGARGLQASLVLLDDTGGGLEHAADLGPYRPVQRLDRHHPGVAPALAVEPVALGAAATVVAVLAPGRAARLPVAAEGVAALAADQQSLQQVADAPRPLARAAPVLGQLLPRALEQPLVDDRRDRDGDPALGRRRDLARRPPRHGGATARRAQRRPPGHGAVLAEDRPSGVGPMLFTLRS